MNPERKMAERQDERLEPKMDPAELYREEIVTDRRVGTIRVLTPIRSDGSADAQRGTVYIGEAQIYTNMGALPLSFEIPAAGLAEAVTGYADAAKEAVDRAMRELEELRRQAASSIVIPRGGTGGGNFGPGGLPGGGLGGGGKIQLP
jgi:regulator of protease activity HflC (stomatin/prohibitin superfamily)